MRLFFSFSCFMSLLLAPSAFAAEKLTATYKFYWNGILVSQADTSATISDEAYDFAMDFRMRGIAKMFANGRSSAHVAGALQDGSPMPTLYENSGKWDGKEFAQTMTFDTSGGLVEQTLDWPEKWLEEFKREPVPDDMKIGPDPASLVIELIRLPMDQVTSEEPVVIRAFDGDSVFDWSVSCAAETTDLEESGKSPFYGAAHECGFGGELIAGKRILTEKQKKKAEKRRKKEEKRRAKGKEVDEPKPPKIWVQSFDNGGYVLPVRAEVSTGMGRVVMYLTDLTFDGAVIPNGDVIAVSTPGTATAQADGLN